MSVVFGPWIGEFGWELSYWQGWVRFLKATKYANEECIVVSYPGRECLYEFADEFISLPDFFVQAVEKHEIKQVMENCIPVESPIITQLEEWFVSTFCNHTIVRYNRAVAPHHIDQKFHLQKLIQLKSTLNLDLPPLVTMFPRFRRHDTLRNWSRDNWIELAAMVNKAGYPVFMIGSKESGLAGIELDLTFDKVGNLTLNEQLAYVNASVAAVSSYCGAIHLLRLAGCPLVTFVEKKFSRDLDAREGRPLRITPFGTAYIECSKEGSWDNKPVEIFTALQSLLP
jgi:hypothetical protein